MKTLFQRLLDPTHVAKVCLALVTLACLTPIWITRYLPLLDDSNHLSALYVVTELRSPTSPLHALYEQRFGLVPYSLHYVLGYAFSFVASAEVAHKLALSSYVLALAAAAWIWTARTQRSLWLAVPLPMLAFGVSWANGYHAFNIGVPVYLLALAAFDALLERYTLARLLLAIVASFACYLSHAVIVALFLGTLPLLVLLRAPTWRPWIASGALWLSLLGLFVREAQRSTSGGKAWQALLNDRALRITVERIVERATGLLSYAFDVVASPWDQRFGTLLLCVMSIAALLAAVIARAEGANAPAPSMTLSLRERLLERRALVLAGVIACIYFLGPNHLKHPDYMWIFAGRFAPLLLFFAALAMPRVELPRKLGATIYACTLVCVLGYVAVIADAYRAFDRDMRPLAVAVDQCPDGAPLLTIGMRPFKHVSVNVEPLGGRIAGWIQAMHGGYDPYYFPRRVPFPFAVRRDLPAPRLRMPEQFPKSIRQGDYDCLLTHRLKTQITDRRYVRVFTAGDFALWLHRRRMPELAPPARHAR